MYKTTINFHKRLQRGEVPILFIVIKTDLGYRAYAEKELSLVSDIEAHSADGSVTADGTYTAGSSLGFLEKSARLLSFSPSAQTIQPQKRGLLFGYTQKQQKHASATLINTDRYFSKLIAKEPFLTKEIYVYLSFEALPFDEAKEDFRGVIENLTITPEKFTLEAVEA